MSLTPVKHNIAYSYLTIKILTISIAPFAYFATISFDIACDMPYERVTNDV